MREAIDAMPVENRGRVFYLMLKNALQGTTEEEYAELRAIQEQFELCRSERRLSGVTEIPDQLQRIVDAAATDYPEFREYATERTWVGDFYSPRHCAYWWVQVEKSSLLPDIREKAVLLLKRRVRNCMLAPSDVSWLCGVLEDSSLDLGPEGQQPWLREHLEDGVVSYVLPSVRTAS